MRFWLSLRWCFFLVLCLAVIIGTVVRAANPATPIAIWHFGAEEATPLIAHGGVHRDQPGPRPPTFPDFEATNTAVKFDGSGAHFSYADPGPNSPFDFTNGDAITIEAWVNVEDLRGGENSYIIGKGRTGTPGFARDNQNWALRVREGEGLARVSFLFATPLAGKAAGAKADAHWHRWTSNAGFAPGSGWHHIAASYKFGDSNSIRGWIDGKPVTGTWDMGGATNEAPVVDDDAIWIASSQGGNPGNSFRGWLDEIAVFREITTDEVMASRYRREGPATPVTNTLETMPDFGAIPTGQVLFSFHEGLAAHERWPKAEETIPDAVTRWTSTYFLLPRLPLRYDDWGIRAGWKAPVLTRLAADVNLAPGKQRFLIRARGLSRLWVNGEIIARTKAHAGSSDGHENVLPPSEPPLPGVRPVGFGDNEAFGEALIPADGKCRILFEAIVGGKKLRPEPGELCVGVQAPDGKSFNLLQTTGTPIPLTDAAFEPAKERVEAALIAFDDQTRRKEAQSQRAFWEKRHSFALKWVQQNPAPSVPVIKNIAHPIDAFLLQKIEKVKAASSDDKSNFHSDVLPILSDNCFRCHGEKDKGGLRLNSREGALKAGDSDKPAVVPNKPQDSELIKRIRSTNEAERMPPTGHGLSATQIAALEKWIQNGALWPAPPVAAEAITLPPQINDAAFLRRVYLDTVGVPPGADAVRAFLQDKSTDKRTKIVDKLLQDERWADHWVSYWQDVLAENPNMLKPSLNNTGPFRWYLYEALRDNKPLDRMVTELIMLRGSEREGGSAGFGLAADNDAPLAAKGQIIAGAFLGVELQCARCHDSPYHSTKQRDLYALAAMMARKPLTVPKSSSVPKAFFDKKARESLIKVTLQPGEPVTPSWPFSQMGADDATLDTLLQKPSDTRERLTALITAPQNTRFAQVAVNRIWKRIMGAGLVEAAHDWEGRKSSHPELLDWLAKEFVAHHYDVKHIARLILTSQAYGREATGKNLQATPEQRFFNAPERRRLTAEQVLDSLYVSSGHRLETEELTFDPDSRRPADTMISLGFPRRAWMFSTLSNERDRPSLSLPRAQAVVDVLEAFGWNGSRQSPRTDRESDPNVLQPGVLANSLVSTWVTRAAQGSEMATLAVETKSPDELVDALFLRFFNRFPTPQEKAPLVKALNEGFNTRLAPTNEIKPSAPLSRLGRVSWSNHLVPEATTIKLELERRARTGTPPDRRLKSVWRETYEDLVWSLINSREFVWMP